MRRPHVLTALAGVVAAATLAPGLGVAAQAASSGEVVEGLGHATFSATTTAGDPVRGDILSFDPDHPNLDVRTVMAKDVVPGLESTLTMSRRVLPRGAIAGTNAGFWLPRPSGAPNGYAVQNGFLVGAQSVSRSGTKLSRGAMAIGHDGHVTLDRVDVDVTLTHPGGEFPVTELNREPRDDEFAPSGELLAYDRHYGERAPLAPSSVVVVVGSMRPRPNGTDGGTVVDTYWSSTATSIPIPADGMVLAAWGTSRPTLEGVQDGDAVALTGEPKPWYTDATFWQGARYGLPGGPYIVKDGQATSLSEWRSEAFSDTHLTSRHPRTAVGVKADGTILLVTVDGRQPGRSHGFNMRELAAQMIALGAEEALALDGGGSTTMTIAGEIVNRPSEANRTIASGLFIYYDPPVAVRDPSVHACPPGEVPATDFVDISGNTHQATIQCLVWYAITSGRSPDRYAPDLPVTRAQMATFLAAFLDQAAANGSSRDLPQGDGVVAFTDVSPTHPHRSGIERVSEAGIALGKSATTFAPEDQVTRAQMATFIARTLQHARGAALPDGPNLFADDTASVHEANTDRLGATGIVGGVSPGIYRPMSSVQRSAMSAFLMRAMDLLVEEGRTAPPD